MIYNESMPAEFTNEEAIEIVATLQSVIDELLNADLDHLAFELDQVSDLIAKRLFGAD